MLTAAATHCSRTRKTSHIRCIQPRSRRYQTPEASAEAVAAGHAFEHRVANYFRSIGKWNVKVSVIHVDKFGCKSEIDVQYGYIFKKYIECKCYAPGHTVPFEDVSKFKQVLELNGISPQKGLFITTSTYSPRCRHIGIECWDGKDFAEREITGRKRYNMIRVCSQTQMMTYSSLGCCLSYCPWWELPTW